MRTTLTRGGGGKKEKEETQEEAERGDKSLGERRRLAVPLPEKGTASVGFATRPQATQPRGQACARAQGRAMEDNPADANPATTAREMCDRYHGASPRTADPAQEPTHPR